MCVLVALRSPPCSGGPSLAQVHPCLFGQVWELQFKEKIDLGVKSGFPLKNGLGLLIEHVWLRTVLQLVYFESTLTLDISN